MSVPYTFTVNGHSYASMVKRYSYQTDRIPVESERITTMDGIDHVAVIRYRGILRVEINPQTEADFKSFCDDIAGGILQVGYHCLQTKTDVLQNMTVTGMPGALAIMNSDRKLINGLSLTFTEL